MQTKKLLIKKVAAGFSLIEFFIVIALSAMLFTELSYLYLGNKTILTAQTNLARAQENKRFAANILLNKISMAGFSGCGKINNLQLRNHTSEDFSLASSVRGYDGFHLPPYLQHKVLFGTDVIEIKKADLEITALAADAVKESNTIKVLQNPATENNRLLLIADCTQADLFLAQNWRGNLVRVDALLAHDYRQDAAEVARYEMLAFFISATGRKDSRGKSIYSLYMVVNRGNKQELLEGIDAMQISYKIGGFYYRAGQINESRLWEKVQSVVINLRLQNAENVETKDAGWFKVYIKLQQR